MKILNIFHFYAYHILTEGVVIFVIKIDGFLNILCHLESILLFGGMSLSMGRKYLGNTDEFLRVIGEAPCPLLFGCAELLIMYHIFIQG